MNSLDTGDSLKTKFTALLGGGKSRLLVVLGIVGMGFILLSSFISTGAKNNPSVGSADQISQEYVTQLEKRLTDLVGQVQGVGRCEVMVTAETGVEYVYAVEQNENASQTNSYEGDEVKRETQQQNLEQKYIVVDTGSGKREALLKTQKQPAIRGVVVVCEGASSMVVQERITRVVTTALGIPYNRVCVTPIK
ncbi:hypothetical protein [Marasmitruncus massiliensis]|jgi:stage III sporulation protein AG|uniref:hypothetical protein n=1 Tax=Marasmitruncus massiliensis TaxID=1944642 RepID=UPI000C7B0FED|nr:hypothetical protein [Marasmitruncus massiliensis]MBE6907071.1 hypothetical protein [Oscillospiraceae bacterium]